MVSGYNDLVSRIEENIILAYKTEISQKKTELQMLQYQINPHFLYNTLNIVSALAKLNGIEEISRNLGKPVPHFPLQCKRRKYCSAENGA